MKTPDEIKKALEFHKDGRACHDCPYEQVRTFSVDGVTFGCSKDIVSDALAYIEQLEAERTEKEILKPRSIIMPDGRDINNIEYKIDISVYEQKQTADSIVFRIVQGMSGQLKVKMEGKSHE